MQRGVDTSGYLIHNFTGAGNGILYNRKLSTDILPSVKPFFMSPVCLETNKGWQRGVYTSD
jgi:hypothetical protein